LAAGVGSRVYIGRSYPEYQNGAQDRFPEHQCRCYSHTSATQYDRKSYRIRKQPDGIRDTDRKFVYSDVLNGPREWYLPVIRECAWVFDKYYCKGINFVSGGVVIDSVNFG
jgi:hypothetical protein